MLLSRLAYVDIFGSVIDVQEAAPEPMPMRQWRDSIGHVLTPRFLFPDKPVLSDSEVYMRLARRFATEDVRMGTSISVGYMGENFADLGFPGMLVGIAALGLIIAGVIRIVMSFNLPLMVREGIVMALAFVMSRDGVEVSLAKTLGGMVMFLLVFLLLNKFVFGRVMVWLNHQGPAMRARPS
jgi:multisubunit Na+/H+ antiporter MnhB subunit